MSNFNSADIAAFKDVWVFCEQREGKLMPTDFELISKGRDLANELGVNLCGLLLGACSTTRPDGIRPGDAQRLSTVQDAVVLNVRPVVVEGQQSGVGGVSGAVIGAKRRRGWPSRPTKNLVKFQRMRVPKRPDSADVSSSKSG